MATSMDALFSLDVNDKAMQDQVASKLGSLKSPTELVATTEDESTQDKSQYQERMISRLSEVWREKLSEEEIMKMVDVFINLADHINEHGALIFGAIIAKADFKKLISSYNAILATSGSNSWIHSATDLKNHIEFLIDKDFNAAFLHPLLVALISYSMGGPIRLVYARGKDTAPVSILARDCMLHVDNSPFAKEYKLILTWEKDKVSGPVSHNFTFLPGTHKGGRECYKDLRTGLRYTTENSSIFTDTDKIEMVLNFQMKATHKETPTIVEVKHDEKPLTTIFNAGALVHHRNQTTDTTVRSSIILAFHLVSNNPGQFTSSVGFTKETDLNQLLFASSSSEEDIFLNAIAKMSVEMLSLMRAVSSESHSAVIDINMCTLSPEDIVKWKAHLTRASKIEDYKAKILFPKKMTRAEFITLIVELMRFDQQGSLDLIQYCDGHEEARKWARNQIRDMKPDELKKHIHSNWADTIKEPHQNQLLSVTELQSLAIELESIAKDKQYSDAPFVYCEEMVKTREDAYLSIRQLLVDIREALPRCENKETYLTTCFFLFWSCDILMRYEEVPDPKAKIIGENLFGNYVSVAVTIAKMKYRSTF